MASLRDIRKRIKSVKSTQQITKAMKMVAAAKLRKAQEAIIAARPFAQMLDGMIADLAARSEAVGHPLLQSRPVKKVELVVLTSDRGLAGGFNTNVIRRASRFLYENAQAFEQLQVSTIGRKGHDYFRRHLAPGEAQRNDGHAEFRKDFAGLYTKVSFRSAQDIATELSTSFLEGKVDAVYLVYNEFLSAISQRVSLVPLLPLAGLPTESEAAPVEGAAPRALATPAAPRAQVDFKYEPGREDVLGKLVPQALAIKVYRALLESVAAEQGARMSAMENATKNAAEMIGSLTLFYNRTRQAVITKELMEIVSGAEALK
ncbi:MAG: ATP synthase F1 subunit gamma [Myxococcaceae bacterium]